MRGGQRKEAFNLSRLSFGEVVGLEVQYGVQNKSTYLRGMRNGQSSELPPRPKLHGRLLKSGPQPLDYQLPSNSMRIEAILLVEPRLDSQPTMAILACSERH